VLASTGSPPPLQPTRLSQPTTPTAPTTSISALLAPALFTRLPTLVVLPLPLPCLPTLLLRPAHHPAPFLLLQLAEMRTARRVRPRTTPATRRPPLPLDTLLPRLDTLLLLHTLEEKVAPLTLASLRTAMRARPRTTLATL
jgi:hypothetical protein